MLFQVLILLTDFMIFICQLFNKSFDPEIESSHIFLICDSLAFSFVRRQYSKNCWKTSTAAIFKAERPSRKQHENSLKRKLYSVANLTLKDISRILRTWSRGDTNFIFECSKYLSRVSRGERLPDRYFQHKKIKFVSTSGHVMFCLIYIST